MAMTRLLLLPTDIICEICRRLSIRDATRLGCVCKYLRSLVTNTNEHVNLPYYHLCHSSHTKNILVIFDDLYCPSKTWQDPKEVIQQFKNMKLTDPLYLGDFRFIGSCNGIICFGKWDYGSNKMTIYLWNPALHQIRPLPQTPVASLIMYFQFLGFGYDVSSRDCKFVGIYSRDKVDIYSLKSNSWRRINYTTSTRTRSCYGRFVLNFNGCLYWILTWEKFVGIYDSIKEDVKFSILSFNIGSEKLCDYLIPCSITNNGFFCGLGVFKGCLSFLIYYQRDDKYEIWSKSDKSWTKTHGFNHNKLSHGDGYEDCLEKRPFYRFLFTPGGKIFVKRTNQLKLVDLETDHMDIIKPEKPPNSTRLFVGNYVESLFSIMPTEKAEQVANYERAAQVSPISNEKKKKTRARRWFRCFFGC